MSDLQRNLQAVEIVQVGNEFGNASPCNGAVGRGWLVKVAMMVAVLGVVAGCRTQHEHHEKMAAKETTNAPAAGTNAPAAGTNAPMADTNALTHSETIILREGDLVKITFPTAANLNTPATTIRRDGNISLTLVGDVKAAGKTLAQLKEEVLVLYKDQTDSKELTVELVSSLFPVFVTGAVLQPHKVMSDHPITALETIMECGGFDYSKANLKSVTVLRQEGTHLKSFHLNLKNLMQGKDEEPFYMKPSDIIYVKEKFSWF